MFYLLIKVQVLVSCVLFTCASIHVCQPLLSVFYANIVQFIFCFQFYMRQYSLCSFSIVRASLKQLIR